MAPQVKNMTHLMARYFGANEDLRTVVGASGVLSAVCAAVFLAAGQLLAKPALGLLPPLMGGSGVFWGEVLARAGADMILVPGYLWTMKKTEKLTEVSGGDL